MKYTTYDHDGKPVENGRLWLGQKADVDIPTHGSITVEVATGMFLSFTTSEWMLAHYSDHPVTWANQKDEVHP